MRLGERHLFTWVHLSDLHFGHGDTSYQWDQREVLDILGNDIERALDSWPELPLPNAVFVTGDISFSGGEVDDTEYSQAQGWFDRLAQTLGLEHDSFYMVPGNHDVQRGIADWSSRPGAV